MSAPWYSHFQLALRWGSYVAAHGLVTIVLLAVIVGIQWIVIAIGDPKLFDWIPLRYLFDVMSLGIMFCFLVFGTLEAIRVFREQRDEQP